VFSSRLLEKVMLTGFSDAGRDTRYENRMLFVNLLSLWKSLGESRRAQENPFSTACQLCKEEQVN
jgi:hypothetical protein